MAEIKTAVTLNHIREIAQQTVEFIYHRSLIKSGFHLAPFS